MKTLHKLLTLLVAGLGVMVTETACTSTQVVAIDIENPNLQVGTSTVVRLEVLASWFTNPVFYYKADRGRIVGMNGETGPENGYVRAGNEVRYFAPYTSTYPAANGYQQGDVIHVFAQNGTAVSPEITRQVLISGSTVVFSTTQSQGQNGPLMIATDSGNGIESNPQPLRNLSGATINGSSPAISPDGRRIAYVNYPGDGSSQIWERDASGQVQALTNQASGLAVDPSWSPDGNFLLYASNGDTSNGTFDIYQLTIDGTDGSRSVTRLTNNTWDDRHPAWNPVPSAPSTQSIAVASKKNDLNSPGSQSQSWNVFLMDRTGNYTREVSQVGGDGQEWAIEPAWRPDGNAIAYTRFGPINNVTSNAANFQRIFVQELQQSVTYTPLNVSNTDPTSRESSPVWAMDQSNAIYFLRSDGSTGGGGRIYRSVYTPGVTGSQYPPQVVGAFQGLFLPISLVGGTNRDVQGFHPLDWR
ncbi:MAG TPA: hypothetical protein V6D47_20600 [Oscillatoriaceae cyanobacterium]